MTRAVPWNLGLFCAAGRLTYLVGDDISKKGANWRKHPGALAGRLRRVQTPVRMLGIALPLLVLAWAAALAGRGSQKTIVQKV